MLVCTEECQLLTIARTEGTLFRHCLLICLDELLCCRFEGCTIIAAGPVHLRLCEFQRTSLRVIAGGSFRFSLLPPLSRCLDGLTLPAESTMSIGNFVRESWGVYWVERHDQHDPAYDTLADPLLEAMEALVAEVQQEQCWDWKRLCQRIFESAGEAALRHLLRCFLPLLPFEMGLWAARDEWRPLIDAPRWQDREQEGR